MNSHVRKIQCLILISIIYLSANVTGQSPADSASLEKIQKDVVKYFYKDLDSSFYHIDRQILFTKEKKMWEDYIEGYIFKVRCSGYFFKIGLNYKCLKETDWAFEQYADSLNTQTERELWLLKEIYWGNYYIDLERYDQALDVFKRIISKVEGLTNRTERETEILSSSLRYLASIYKDQGQYQKALDGYRYSLNFTKTHPSNSRIPLVFTFLGIIHLEMGDTLKAHTNHLKAFEALNKIHENYPEKKDGIRNLYTGACLSLANTFIALNKPDSSILMIEKALSIQTNNAYLANTLFRAGEVYFKLDQYDKALDQYYEALELRKEIYGEKHSDVAEINIAIGKVFIKKENDQKALIHFQKALTNCSEEFNSEQWYDNPDLSHRLTHKELLEALHYKSKLLFVQSKKGYRQADSLLLAAFQTNQLAIELVDSIRLGVLSGADKVFLFEQSYPIFESGILISNHLNQSISVKDKNKYAFLPFEIAEKSKAITLLENIQHVKAFSGLPDTLIEKEKRLKLELVHMKTSLYKLQSKQLKEEELAKYHKNIFELQEEYNQVIQSFEEKFLPYYRLKYDLNLVGVDNVQQELLADNQALFDYFLGDSTLFIFCITKDNYTILKYPVPISEIQQKVQNLRNTLINRNEPFAQSRLEEASHELFQVLLKDALGNLDNKINHLIIVPDDVLGYLPFEMLLTKPVEANDKDESSLAFLQNDFTISYASSASLLYQQQQVSQNRAPKNFAGFAPSYESLEIADIGIQNDLAQTALMKEIRSGTYNLKGTKDEVEKIAQLLDGKAFIGVQASEHQFVQNAGNYRILHLAMHSLLEDKQPLFSKLLFTPGASDSLTDDQLNTIELYNLSLQADLAVLSACETGFGKLYRGEGIMSLARAFTYAGVPSTVMSLWKVPDEATAVLMILFFENLKKGQDKATALRSAKTTFLYQARKNTPEWTHPYYWSGFVLSGNTAPLETFSEPSSWPIAIAGFISLGLLFFFYKYRRKQELVVSPNN